MDSEILRQRIITDFELPNDFGADSQFLLSENFDSLKLLELVSYIEELAGIEAGDAPLEYPLLATLDDAVLYYKELTERPGT